MNSLSLIYASLLTSLIAVTIPTNGACFSKKGLPVLTRDNNIVQDKLPITHVQIGYQHAKICQIYDVSQHLILPPDHMPDINARIVFFDITKTSAGVICVQDTIVCSYEKDQRGQLYRTEEELQESFYRNVLSVKGNKAKHAPNFLEKQHKIWLKACNDLKKEGMVFADETVRERFIALTRNSQVTLPKCALYIGNSSFIRTFARVSFSPVLIIILDKKLKGAVQDAAVLHEIGHIVQEDHLKPDAVDLVQSREREYTADTFAYSCLNHHSGYLAFFKLFCNRLKATPNATKDDRADQSHPSDYNRAQRCLEGFKTYLKSKESSLGHFIDQPPADCDLDEITTFKQAVACYFPESLIVWE